MTVAPASAANGLLKEMGYKPVTIVDKIRSEYKLDELTIAVDVVKDLGTFLEIEIVCNDEQKEMARKKIMSVAKGLGLSEQDLETRKYDQLVSNLN